MIVELTDIEAEKVNACIMLIAKDFALKCHESGIDINANDNLANCARYYSELAKKFKPSIIK